MISVAVLKPRTFKSWADEIMNYLSSMPGNNLHVNLDNYSYEYSVPSKPKDVSQMERVINSLNQDLPLTKEWNKFLMNYKSKRQIVNLLVDYIKSGRIRDKAVTVNQESECFFIEHGNDCVRFPELDSSHREAGQKIPMHTVYVRPKKNDTVCVVANDTDIYLNLINISRHIRSYLYFRQEKTISYIHAIAVHLDKEICQILPCFYTLTGSDFTNPFFGRSKIKAFKKMLETAKSHKILLSLLSGQPDIEEVTNFILHNCI